MGEPRPAAGVEPGLLAASLAMALLLMAFGALATLGGALLLRLLSGIRIMTAISQAAAATFFILLMPAGVCRLIARIRGWDPDPDPTERNWSWHSTTCIRRRISNIWANGAKRGGIPRRGIGR